MKTPTKLLAVDIGNSTISYAIFLKSRVSAYGYTNNGDIPKIISFLNKNGGSTVNYTVITSVVPNKCHILIKALKASFPAYKVLIVGKHLKPRLRMKYKSHSLGSDRLVNLYGALKMYRPPILIIDFGTAITFDYVSKKGIFEGGLIVPGVETSWKAIQEKAALLPKLRKIKQINDLTPKNTVSAMSAGVLHGFGAMSEGLITRFKKAHGSNLKVIATGGVSKLMAKYCPSFNIVDPLHTLKSLRVIFREEIAKKHLDNS